MTRSESPYDRLGAPVELDRDARRVTPGQHATIFAVAHEQLGEWREWRAILDASDERSPFDLLELEHTLSDRIRHRFATLDETGSELVNLTDDLDFGLGMREVTPELQGEGRLVLEDLSETTFQLTFQAPGEDAPGEAVVFDREGGARHVLLTSGRFVLGLTMSDDVLLVLWMARELIVYFEPVPRASSALTIPGVDLG